MFTKTGYLSGCFSSLGGVPPGAMGTVTATAFTGRCPIVVDTSAHKLWIYDGSWKWVALT